MESKGMQILNKMISDYQYWKQTGKFPEEYKPRSLIELRTEKMIKWLLDQEEVLAIPLKRKDKDRT